MIPFDPWKIVEKYENDVKPEDYFKTAIQEYRDRLTTYLTIRNKTSRSPLIYFAAYVLGKLRARRLDWIPGDFRPLIPLDDVKYDKYQQLEGDENLAEYIEAVICEWTHFFALYNNSRNIQESDYARMRCFNLQDHVFMSKPRLSME